MSHCTVEEVGMELAERLEKVTDDLDLRKIRGGIDLLKKRGASALNACTQVGQGLFTFIWAKIGQYIEGVKKGTVKLVSVASTAKAAVTDLSATIRYPESESRSSSSC